ncbi:hypothetical protein MASR1M60_13840 [Rhodocyclaceae bacterium]
MPHTPSLTTILSQHRENTDQNHLHLAEMLNRIATSCRINAPSARQCANCPSDAREACQNTLIEVAMEFMTFLIDHQRCEDELMTQLPRTRHTEAHCTSHREAHFEFCTRYNKTILHFHARAQSENIHTLEILITDWIRQHAIDFDNRFSQLIEETHV